MLTVIVVMVPLTVPKLFGYHIYGVLTGSMTPAYPVGSVVYIRTCEPEEVTVGDVITFRMGTDTEHVMTHRVVEVDSDMQSFVTKGDANNAADAEPVSFDRLIGKAVLCIPGLADVADQMDTLTGKAVLFIAFALAFIFWVIADLISPKKGNKESKQKEEAVSNAGRTAMRLVGLAMIVGAVVYLGYIMLQYHRGNAEYDALERKVFEEAAADEAVNDNQNVEEPGNSETVTSISAEDRKVMTALRELMEENENVIGWIAFDNMDLSYPIMQGTDNTYYLKHTYSGEENSAGSIFMEAGNHPDFNDCHTIIYGHNMKNLSMFGRLKKYKTEEFYEEHQYFTIYTDEEVYRYRIFAYYDIPEDGDIYTIGYSADDEFGKFIDKMKRRSYYDTGVEVTKDDKIVTLSTCSTTGNRFVINAKREER